MVELASFPTLEQLRARLAEESLSCPPAVALIIARQVARSLEQCFDHGLCPSRLSLNAIQIAPKGEVVVQPSHEHVLRASDAITAMAHVLIAFASPSPVIDPICRALQIDAECFADAHAIIDRANPPADNDALVRLVDYLLRTPSHALADLPLFDRAPALVDDTKITVIELGRRRDRPAVRVEESDPNQWFMGVVPREKRHRPGR